MNKIDVVKESLELILKYGDLYDMIALKENVKPMTSALLKTNILLFSRILYGGVFIYDKIKAYFASIDKVREAQEQIRKYLGCNIDIIRSKEPSQNVLVTKINKPYLSVLYQKGNIDNAKYIENLRKILSFCEKYAINEILLRIDDIYNIYNLFEDIELNDFRVKDLLEIFEITLDEEFDDEFDDEFLSLNVQDLLKLIEKLEAKKIDKSFLLKIEEQIEDLTIKMAIQDFLVDSDLTKLKHLVHARLSLILNSNGVFKDKEYGKCYQNITLYEERIKILSYTKNQKIISNDVMSLYEYLDIVNNKSLIPNTINSKEEKELLLIVQLHLYLCGKKEEYKLDEENNDSFYDKIYRRYIEKKKGNISKIDGMYSKKNKYINNIGCVISSIIIPYILACALVIVPGVIDLVKILRGDDSNISEDMLNTIKAPYKASYNLEKELFYNVFGKIKKVTLNFSSLTGDASNDNEDTMIGEICVLPDYALYRKICHIPKYFARSYATSASYSKGSVEYNLVKPEVDFSSLKEGFSIFQINYFTTREELEGMIQENRLKLFQNLYPLGDDYVLTGVKLSDKKDQNKSLVIDYERAIKLENYLTEEEIKLLMSMESPIISYDYGLGIFRDNSFVNELHKSGAYQSLSYEEVREAIIRGLDLEKEATIDEILKAIESKTYSKTPIKDAHLSFKIRRMDEEEYYETVASLDSLICNLAATLAVSVDDKLIYTVGFMDNGDHYLKMNEAHAWATDKEGDIVDVTPSTPKKESALEKDVTDLLLWGLENKIPLYALLLFITVEIEKKYRKKLIFNFNVYKVEKLLNTNDIESAYAKIKEVLYGGINIPKKSTPSDLVEMITKEFYSFTKKDLQELKKELKMSNIEDKHLLNNTLKLIDEIMFIEENSNDLEKIFTKKR